jgi:hypothetical protein
MEELKYVEQGVFAKRVLFLNMLSKVWVVWENWEGVAG